MKTWFHVLSTPQWGTPSNFLDAQLEEKISRVKMLTADGMPLILLKENINIYKAKNIRLFKDYGDNMWKFTVRGLVRPFLMGWRNQYDIKNLNFSHIELENNL